MASLPRSKRQAHPKASSAPILIRQASREPTKLAAPPAYPSTTQMGLLHTALGNELPAFLTGERDAAATLAAVEEAYTTSAKEAGVLQ